jgi:hypothetical protein
LVAAAVTQEELEAAHCWVASERVPGRPEMTDFRRAVRHHHAMWREAQGYPMGTQRSRPGQPLLPVGSRLDLDFARESGATFLTAKALTAKALAAARACTSFVEAHQSFGLQGFWADLLSSEALAVNLFGDLAADPDRANRAVRAWWPDVPGRVRVAPAGPRHRSRAPAPQPAHPRPRLNSLALHRHRQRSDPPLPYAA